jgi:hypothetical protein
LLQILQDKPAIVMSFGIIRLASDCPVVARQGFIKLPQFLERVPQIAMSLPDTGFYTNRALKKRGSLRRTSGLRGHDSQQCQRIKMAGFGGKYFPANDFRAGSVAPHVRLRRTLHGMSEIIHAYGCYP